MINDKLYNNIINLASKKLSKEDFNKSIEEINGYHTDAIYSSNKLIDLNLAKTKIEELNIFLKTKCPELMMTLNYYYNFKSPDNIIPIFNPSRISSNIVNDLYLCLCNNRTCISSILIEYNSIDDDFIEITLQTNKENEGKKYIKFLISVIIIISKLIYNNKKRIYANAINPITTWIILKNFNGEIPKKKNILFFQYLERNKLELSNITFDKLSEYHDLNSIDIYINLDDKEIDNTMFLKCLYEISCS